MTIDGWDVDRLRRRLAWAGSAAHRVQTSDWPSTHGVSFHGALILAPKPHPRWCRRRVLSCFGQIDRRAESRTRRFAVSDRRAASQQKD